MKARSAVGEKAKRAAAVTEMPGRSSCVGARRPRLMLLFVGALAAVVTCVASAPSGFAAAARKPAKAKRAPVKRLLPVNADDDPVPASSTAPRPTREAAVEEAETEAGPDKASEREPDGREGPQALTVARRRSPKVVRAGLEMSGYHDNDFVNVLSPTISGNVADPVAGWSAGGRYLLDAVSAASVDVVSAASGPFKELRHVVGGDLKYKAESVGVGVSGGVSHEPDYLSISVGGTLTLELMDKNLVPVFGYSYGHDTAGRAGTPYEIFSRVLIKHALRAGATIIVDPATSLDVVADVFIERGNQAKPYRYVPLFAPGGSDKIGAGASVADVTAARLSIRALDELPLTRNRVALTGRLAHRFSGAALRIDERLYEDDWGLKASTTDLRYVVDLGRNMFIWPHLRAHVQSAVIFWKRAYEATIGPDGGMGVPSLRTGDRELGSLHAFTLGGGYRVKLGHLTEQSLWTLTLQGDFVSTSYADAIYITQRVAYFGALTLDAAFD